MLPIACALGVVVQITEHPFRHWKSVKRYLICDIFTSRQRKTLVLKLNIVRYYQYNVLHASDCMYPWYSSVDHQGSPVPPLKTRVKIPYSRHSTS